MYLHLRILNLSIFKILLLGCVTPNNNVGVTSHNCYYENSSNNFKLFLRESEKFRTWLMFR